MPRRAAVHRHPGRLPLLNRVTPSFGLPLLFAWLLLWIVLTSVIMLVIYCCDPANRPPPETGPRSMNAALIIIGLTAVAALLLGLRARVGRT